MRVWRNVRRRVFARRGAVALGTIALLAGLYLVVMFPLGCGKRLADRMMLYPSTHDVPAYGATERTVETPVGPVQVWVARSPSAMGRPAERYVLHLMGNGSRAEYAATAVAARWGDVPAEVWAVNYPGYGRSPGPATLDKLAPAAAATYDALAEHAGDAPIYLDCDSMGTAVGLHLAAEKRSERPVAGMVLKNAPPLRQLVMGRFGWWNLWLAAFPVASAIPSELNSVANAQRAWAPAIFVAADADTLIPPDYQRLVYDVYAGPKVRVVLAGADHNTPVTEDEEAEIVQAIRESFR